MDRKFTPLFYRTSSPSGPLPKNENKTLFRISDDELRSKMSDLVSGHEEILNVRAFKCKLSSEQLTQLIFYHAFVVYETDEWWWSVEKNSEGITIQRSKKL